jgi:hypothetical protein
MRSNVAFTRSVYHQAQARDVFSHGEEDLDHYEDDYDLIDEFYAARWKRKIMQLFDDSHHGDGNGDGAAGTPPLSGKAAPQSQERGRSPTHGYGNGGKHSSGDGGVPSAPHRFRARSSLSWSPASINSRPIPRSSKPVNVLDGLPRDVMAYGGRNSLPFRSNVSLSSGISTKTMHSSVCGDDHVMAAGGRNSLPFRPNVSLSSGISTKTMHSSVCGDDHVMASGGRNPLPFRPNVSLSSGISTKTMHSSDGGHDHVMASIGRNSLPARSNVPRDSMSSFGSNSLPARSNVPRDVMPSIGSNSLLARSSPRDVMSSIGSKSLPARSNVPRDVMPSIGSNSLPARSNAPRDVMPSSGRNSLPAGPTVPMTNGQPTRNHSAPTEISFDEIIPNTSAPVHVELSYPMPWASSSPSVTCEGGSGWPLGAVFPRGGGCGAGGPGWPQGGGAPGSPQGAGGPGWPPGNGGPSGSERPGGSGSSRGQAVQGGRMAVQHRTQPTPACYLCGEEGHDNPFCTKNREQVVVPKVTLASLSLSF